MKSSEYITLILPGNTEVPVPAGRWARIGGGDIHATFKREELELAVAIGGAIENVKAQIVEMEKLKKDGDNWL